MNTLVDKIGVRWEIHYPAAFGLLGAVLGYVFGPEALHYVHAKDWAMENIFVAVFTLATVTAGFGLAIYTFLLTTETGFIGRTKRSIYYRHLLTYVLIATVLSAITAFLSVPGMVVKTTPEPHSIHAVYVGVWAGLSVWTASALSRAGYLFSYFAREHH
ncbi:hypothetical protein ACVIWV_002411 [Bradyrhizobium diazoefficiens]